MESIYKRRTDSDLVEEYKQFEKKMKKIVEKVEE